MYRRVAALLLLGLFVPATAAADPVDNFGDPLPDGAVARLGTTRLRHHNRIDAVAFSDDGRRLATSATFTDPTVRVWDVAGGRELLRAVVPPDVHAMQVAFLPGGDRVAALVRTGTLEAEARLMIWDVASGRVVQDIPLGPDRGSYSSTLAVAPDGRTAAVGCQPLRLVDLQAGRVRHALPAGDGFLSASFSADSRLLATCRVETANAPPARNRVQVWDVAAGTARTAVPGGGYLAAFGPDGDTLALASRDERGQWPVRRVSLRDVDGAARVLATLPQPPARLAFARDGRRLLVGLRGGEKASGAELWGLETGARQTTVSGPGPGWPATAVAFDADGVPLAAFTRYNRVRIFDVVAGRECGPVGAAGAQLAAAAVTPDGRAVLTADEEGELCRWGLATGALLDRRPTDGRYHVAVFSPDARRLLHGPMLIDAATGATVARVSDPMYPISAAFSPDSRHVAVGTGYVELWEAETGRPLRTLWLCSLVDEVRASFGDLGLPHRPRLPTFGGPAVQVRELAFLPDGRSLTAVCSINSQGFGAMSYTMPPRRPWPSLLACRGLRWFDWRTGKEDATRHNPDGVLLPIRSPDGALTLRIGHQRIEVVQVATGQRVCALADVEPRRLFPPFRFSADNRLLAAVANMSPQPAELCVWDIRTGAVRLRRSRGLAAPMRPVGFTPDGRRLVAAHGDGTLLVWDVPAGP